jgi:hypothetical protein
MQIRSADKRPVTISLFGKDAWHGSLEANKLQPIAIRHVELPPGDTILFFHSDLPPTLSGLENRRKISFGVWNFEVKVVATH